MPQARPSLPAGATICRMPAGLIKAVWLLPTTCQVSQGSHLPHASPAKVTRAYAACQPPAACQPSQSNPAACPPRPALQAKKATCRMLPLPKVIWLLNRHCQTCQPIKATCHMPTTDATCHMPANKATCRMPPLPNQFGLVNGHCQTG